MTSQFTAQPVARHLLRNGGSGISVSSALRSASLGGTLFPVVASKRPTHAIRFASTVVDTSFWKSLIPKPLRRSDAPREKKLRSKEWNPATFFIIIFLLIGSMSINLISMKKDYQMFMRQSEAKIGILRETLEKLQRGEEVDVEKALGAGDPEQESEWEQVLKELERTGQKSNHEKKNRKRQAAKEAAEEQEAAVAKATKPTEINNIDSSRTPVVGRSTFF